MSKTLINPVTELASELKMEPKELLELLLGAIREKREAAKRAVLFFSDEPFSLMTASGTKGWIGKMEFSTDAQAWFEWNGEHPITGGRHSGRYEVYVRGKWNDGVRCGFEIRGCKVACSGNVGNLLDYQVVAGGGEPVMGEGAFCGLFRNCAALISAPELPARTLASRCYEGMFHGCINLSCPPALPATVLADRCYRRMFDGCSALKAAPKLPSETMTEWCYEEMFRNCSHLEAAPELPAAILADGCYSGMFFGCAALTEAPALPANRVEFRGYRRMFCDCTSLKNAPALPAKILGNDAYQLMFGNCPALSDASRAAAAAAAGKCMRVF